MQIKFWIMYFIKFLLFFPLISNCYWKLKNKTLHPFLSTIAVFYLCTPVCYFYSYLHFIYKLIISNFIFKEWKWNVKFTYICRLIHLGNWSSHLLLNVFTFTKHACTLRLYLIITVKPVYKEHLRDWLKVAFADRWPL